MGIQGNTGIGVESHSNGGVGVWGRSSTNIAVAGDSDSSTGVQGYSASGIGVRGISAGGSDRARAGVFSGKVDVGGDLVVYGTFYVDSGVKNFRIDHPLDPQNKYLLHTCVESSEMKNVYDGVTQLDEDGAAWVDLPEWFEALNGNFRYQLTAVGGAAPNLHVAEEIYENRFKIGGGEGGMKVCWQVTGARKDPWAAANPFEVEQEKPQEDRGRYLQPDLYNAPEEQMNVARATATRFEPPQAPEMSPQGFQPPKVREMPPGFAAPGFAAPGFEPPTEPAIPPDVAAPGIDRMEEEYRRQIDELRGQIEELRRDSLEQEMDELRRQIKKLRRRR